MGLGLFKLIPLFTTFAKTFIVNAKHGYKIKNFDKTREKIDTIEHLIVKLDKKINDNTNEIENIRQQIMISRLINIILGILIIFLIFYLR